MGWIWCTWSSIYVYLCLELRKWKMKKEIKGRGWYSFWWDLMTAIPILRVKSFSCSHYQQLPKHTIWFGKKKSKNRVCYQSLHNQLHFLLTISTIKGHTVTTTITDHSTNQIMLRENLLQELRGEAHSGRESLMVIVAKRVIQGKSAMNLLDIQLGTLYM